MIYLFDIDGVLTDTGYNINSGFKQWFIDWSMGKKYALVTGSTLERTYEQIGHEITDGAMLVANCMGNSIFQEGRSVTLNEFEEAKDKVMMGAERRSMVMTEDEKKLTAYHEGGHALVSFNMPSYDPIHKATIIPRGRALGMVMNLPERDKHGHSIKYLKARLAVCFGGRVAEEVIFGKDNISTGAGGGSGSDINQATQLARAMVTKYGMSEEMGPVEYGENQEEVFLGRSVTQTQSVSEEVAQKIDKEIRKLIDEGYNTAKKILTEKVEDLHKIAKALMTYETLTGEEIENIINKNIYPADKQDLKVEDDKGSAMGALGLKPKIVH